MSRGQASGRKKDDRGPLASHAEKVAALYAIFPDRYDEFLNIARIHARKFHKRVSDKDAHDVLQDAIVRIVDKQRKKPRNWYPQDRPFSKFFSEVIKSVASDWYRHAKKTEPPDELASPIRLAAQTEATMILEEIQAALKLRPHAMEILELRCARRTAKQIQRELGISKNVYESAAKWTERMLWRRGFRK